MMQDGASALICSAGGEKEEARERGGAISVEMPGKADNDAGGGKSNDQRKEAA